MCVLTPRLKTHDCLLADFILTTDNNDIIYILCTCNSQLNPIPGQLPHCNITTFSPLSKLSTSMECAHYGSSEPDEQQPQGQF